MRTRSPGGARNRRPPRSPGSPSRRRCGWTARTAARRGNSVPRRAAPHAHHHHGHRHPHPQGRRVRHHDDVLLDGVAAREGVRQQAAEKQHQHGKHHRPGIGKFVGGGARPSPGSWPRPYRAGHRRCTAMVVIAAAAATVTTTTMTWTSGFARIRCMTAWVSSRHSARRLQHCSSGQAALRARVALGSRNARPQ